jgi:hypothetical protein
VATIITAASATGFPISGIGQAAEDYTNVQFFAGYNSFNDLRVRQLPVKDFSGLTLYLKRSLHHLSVIIEHFSTPFR